MVEHDKGPLVCLDCGAQVPRRVGTSGRQPERCPPCKGEDVRRQSRENARARRARLAVGCHVCHGPMLAGSERVCRACVAVLGAVYGLTYMGRTADGGVVVGPQGWERLAAALLQHAPEDCQGCGTPQDDARGGLCGECKAR